MYYLYHIKGVKWGMTENLKKRLRQQGYNLSDVCEIIEKQNIDEGADLEKQLNIKYGYGWNKQQDYRIVKKFVNHNNRYKHNFTKEQCILGGKTAGLIVGNKNKKNGHIQSLQKIATLAAKEKNSKPILQYDFNNNFIEEHKSITDAANKLSIKASGIVNTLKGRYKQSGGFIWKYKT
jgi:DNA-binding transcriptional MerR regulator